MALKLVVLISGRGSNLAAIVHAIAAGTCRAHIARVVSDREGAEGLMFARAHSLPVTTVAMTAHPDRSAWDAALTAAVAAEAPDLVVLAGFMRLLGPQFLARFPQRVINVHPALLPLFPGIAGPADALAAGVRISGCSVHIVDAGIDTGPVIAQAAVPVLPGDDARSLHARIQGAEHALLPRVIDAIASGEISLWPELRIDAGSNAQDVLFSLGPTAPTP